MQLQASTVSSQQSKHTSTSEVITTVVTVMTTTMMLRIQSILLVTTITTLIAINDAFHIPSPLSPPSSAQLEAGAAANNATLSSRREYIAKTLLTVATTTAAATTTSLAISQPANAIVPACPPNSKNCLRQTWKAPPSTSFSESISQLRNALNSYPMTGLEEGKVDGGGYTIISDTLSSSSGSIVLEYRSSGKGTFAKLFNGGKPFVDDVIIEPSSSSSSAAAGEGVFEFRSASRLGDSDFGVNGKRLAYIGGMLKEKGWSEIL